MRFSKVKLTDTFWKPRAEPNSTVTIPLLARRAEGGRGLNGNVLEAAILSPEGASRSRFVAHNPPFSGGEWDAVDCIQLFRATRNKRHLDLARHHLDIHGPENSGNCSQHDQSYKPCSSRPRRWAMR